MSFALREAGLDVQHECMGADGTSSFYYALDVPEYPSFPNESPKGRVAHVGEGSRSDYEWGTIVHLIRDPLLTIASTRKLMARKTQEWYVLHGIIPPDVKPKLLRMMFAWYNLNAEIENITDFRFRMNSKETDWARMAKRLGISGRIPKLPPKNVGSGFMKPDPITWSQMAALDKTLTANIQKMGRRYGCL
jgi:hypothetical protein